MKKLHNFIITVFLITGLNPYAQDKNNEWALSFGINAIDTRTSAGSSHFSQFFNISEHWNILPSVSYLNISKYAGEGFSFGITGSVNKIDKFVNHIDGEFVVKNPGNLIYFGLDGIIKYSFMDMIKSKTIDPFLHIGGGYTWIGNQYNAGTLNGGPGISFWFNENIGLTIQTTYKKSFEERVNMPSHFQHFAGISFKFGAKDTDNDGISDHLDKCPDVAGPKENNGCPYLDTDGDGVLDHLDECPNIAGAEENNGCPWPDADGDGVPDKDDKCPDIVGPKENNGCPWPDTDGDGIPDKDDECPDVAGPKENNGCPWPDTDDDGVPDKDDKCPEVAGTIENHGCPEVTEVIIKKLNDFSKTILFENARATIKKESFVILNTIATIMDEYKNAHFRIDGYSDSSGNKASNLKLSKERAAIVKDYLVARGIDENRLTSEGYGSTNPIASNNTEAGRAQNRRVEVTLIK